MPLASGSIDNKEVIEVRTSFIKLLYNFVNPCS